MMQLTDATRVPPGGQLFYKDPETGVILSHPYFRSLMDKARAHRIANNLPIVSNWAEVFEDNICVNTTAAPCQHRDTGLRRAAAIAKQFASSMTTWAMSGFQLASSEVIEERKAACAVCTYWEDTTLGFGWGRCTKCGGCSTSLKTGMLTEKCPISRWPR